MNKFFLLGLLLFTGVSAHAATYVVDRTDDADVSACSAAVNDCTLRGAMNRANINGETNRIEFRDGVVPSIVLSGTVLPAVTGNLTISNATSSSLKISGADSSAVFRVLKGGELTLSNLTIIDANSSSGAIYAQGKLTANDCTFQNNFANPGGSGGVMRVEYASATLNRCTLDHNSSVHNGGAIIFIGVTSRDTLAIFNCTITQNYARFRGSAISAHGGLVSVDSSTIAGNSAQIEACLHADGSSPDFFGRSRVSRFEVRNSIVAGNSGGDLFFNDVNDPVGGEFVSGGHNIIGVGKGTESFNVAGDTTGVVDPMLAALADNGGATKTRLPLLGSPALDAGDTNLTRDQRGASRPQNGVDDIGAVEFYDILPTIPNQSYDIRVGEPVNIQLQAINPNDRPLTFSLDPSAPLPASLDLSSAGMITGNLLDNALRDYQIKIRVKDSANASVLGSFTLRAVESGSVFVNTTGNDNDRDGKTTLREAVQFAQRRNDITVISFNSDVFGGSRKTIDLNGAPITLGNVGDLTILGPSVGVTISGGGKNQLFVVKPEAKVKLVGLTLTDGKSNSSGGAILNSGDLTIESCTFVGNVAIDGGAIYSNADINDSLLFVFNSTFSGNTASHGGGAITNSVGVVLLDSVTIVGNNALAGGGVFSPKTGSAVTVVRNSIIAGNFGGGVANDVQSERFYAFYSDGFNSVGAGNATGAFTATGDRIGSEVSNIGPLAENGGPTLTRALLPGSVDIDDGQTDLKTDQRGVARPQGSSVDRGAFEVVPITVSVSLSPGAPKTNDTLAATANTNVPVDGSTITLAYIWKKNGAAILGESAATLNLARAGNGDKNDVITCEVTATSASGGQATAEAQVKVANSTPIAISSKGEVPADTLKGFVLNAFDADGDALTYKRVGGPRNGVKADIRVDSADGKTKLFYKSRPFYGGVDIIRFVVFDSDNKQSNVSTLGINVLYTPPPPANRAPIAGDTNIDTYVGKSEVKGLLGSDPDGDAITFRIVGNAKYGTSEIKRDTDGFFKLFYTSLNRFFGPDRVTYIVTDSQGKESNVATVNINFVNRAPVAQGNRVQVASGESVSQFLFANDPDNDAVTYRLVNNPRFGKGEVKLDAQGKWRFFYQSLTGYVGADQITFIAIDAQGKESQVAAIDINVVRVTSSPSSALRSGNPAPSGGSS